MNSAALKVLDETVYSDGSGSAGLYEVYGVRLTGINNGSGKVTVAPLNIRTGYRGGREKGVVKTACKIVEAHVAGLC